MFLAAKHSGWQGWRREAGYPEAGRGPGGGRLKNTDLTVTAPDMPPLPPYVKVAETGTPVRQVEERGQGDRQLVFLAQQTPAGGKAEKWRKRQHR